MGNFSLSIPFPIVSTASRRSLPSIPPERLSKFPGKRATDPSAEHSQPGNHLGDKNDSSKVQAYLAKLGQDGCGLDIVQVWTETGRKQFVHRNAWRKCFVIARTRLRLNPPNEYRRMAVAIRVASFTLASAGVSRAIRSSMRFAPGAPLNRRRRRALGASIPGCKRTCPKGMPAIRPGDFADRP